MASLLFVQNKSVYDPQEKNPKGAVHEDWGLISYDRARETYRILGPDKFIEVFALALPDKEFEMYPENRFQRVRLE